MSVVASQTGQSGRRARRPVIGLLSLPAPINSASFAESIARAWPDAGPPEFRPLDAEPGPALAALMSEIDALLVVAAAGASSGSLARLITATGDSMAPGLLLIDAGADAGVVRRSGAMAVLPLDAPPPLIAGALYALLSRQPAVEQMRRELAGEGLMRLAAARQIEQMQSEANMAVLVQRELLPKELPSMDGLDFAVMFRPGTDLSGDIYDVQRLDERHVGFLVADAAGHGAPAALMTMLIGRLLHMKEVSGKDYRIVPPDEALTRLNDAFCTRRGDMVAIVSAVYGVIDSLTGRVSIANAGHPHPLVVGASGTRAILEGGPLLGTAEGVSYGQETFTLDADQTLIIYSDGFEHAFQADDGAERPASGNDLHLSAFGALGRRRCESLGSAIGTMAGRIDAQRGSLHQVDDITLLAIGRPARAQETARAA